MLWISLVNVMKAYPVKFQVFEKNPSILAVWTKYVMQTAFVLLIFHTPLSEGVSRQADISGD